MKRIDLINFNIISVDKVIGLYDNYQHKMICKANNDKSFRKFSVELTVRPKKRFEILTPEEFNDGKEITYNNIDEILHYEILDDGITGIKKEKGTIKLEKDIKIKSGIRNIDFIETIIDGKIRYIARDAESKHINVEWHFNDYYDWKTANNIIKHDLIEKSDNPIYFEETQEFVNSLIFRRRFGDKEITWDYSKDINIIDEE